MEQPLVRFSDTLFGVGDVIGAHEEVLRREGVVWVGKFGRPLGRGRLDYLRRQVDDGIPTHLFLANRRNMEWRLFSGLIEGLSFELDPVDGGPVPTYYFEKSLVDLVGTWFLISTLKELEPSVLDAVSVVSTGSSGRFALNNSMSGFFIIKANDEPIDR